MLKFRKTRRAISSCRTNSGVGILNKSKTKNDSAAVMVTFTAKVTGILSESQSFARFRRWKSFVSLCSWWRANNFEKTFHKGAGCRRIKRAFFPAHARHTANWKRRNLQRRGKSGLGHTNPAITQNLYIHNTLKLQEETAEIFAKNLQTSR